MLLVAAWAISYLRVCWNSVLAPSVPVRLSLATPGGNLTFTADSYALNPSAGILQLTAARLTDPNGSLIASAKRVEASGIDVLALQKSAPKVTVTDAVGRIVRGPDGEVDIQRYLPKPTGKPSTIPFYVTLNRAEIDVVDEVGHRTWTRHVSVERFRLAGQGPKWIAGGDASVEDLGTAHLVAHHTSNGALAIFTYADKLELADLTRHFIAVQTKAKEPTSIGALSASGPVEFSVGAGEKARFAFTGHLVGSNLAYGGYRASNVLLDGRIGEDGFRGKISANGPNLAATYDGILSWGDTLGAHGNLEVRTASLADLPSPVRKFIPTHLSATQLKFRGLVSYDKTSGPSAYGELGATHAAYLQDVVTGLQAHVSANERNVWAHVRTARYDGARVDADGSLDLAARSVHGYAQIQKLPVSRVLARFPNAAKQIPGQASGALSVATIVNGPWNAPRAEIRLTASGTYSQKQLGHPIAIRRITALARYDGNILTFHRIRAVTESGTLSALGHIDLKSKAISLNVDSRGVDVSQLSTKATGYASITAGVEGTLDHPIASGQLDGYDISYDKFSVALVDSLFRLDEKALTATALDVVFGSSQLHGSLAMALDGRTLSGELHSQGLQLGDLLGDQFAGIVKFDTTEVAGTLDHPRVKASLTGKDLLADDFTVNSLTAALALNDQVFTVTGAVAKVANGSVAASGSYDLDTDKGNARAEGKNLDLSQVVPTRQRAEHTAISGLLNGSATTEFADGKFGHASATGTLSKMKLNGTDIGDGVWSADGAGDQWHGSIQASYGTRFLAFENGAYNTTSDEVSGNLLINNLTIQNIYSTVVPYLDEAQPGTHDLALTDGQIALKATVQGKLHDPNVAIETLDINDLSYNAVDFGELAATGDRKNGLWTISSLDVTDGPMKFSAHGTVDESGATDLDGDLNNLDLSKLAAISTNSPSIGGLLSANFVATGSTNRPKIRASANIENVAIQGRKVDFGLDLNELTLDSTGINASGALSYQGFHGTLTGHVPVAYPFSIPGDQPITADLALAEQPVTDLAPYFPSLDPARASGTLRGLVSLSGTRDNLHLSGGVSISAPRVGFRLTDPDSPAAHRRYIAMSTELQNLMVSLGIQDQSLTADVAATSSHGGKVDAQLSSSLGALQSVLTSHTLPDTDTWLSSPVSGKVAFSGAAMKENNKVLQSSFGIDGTLALSGTLSAPNIAGNLGVSNLQTSIPSLATQGGTRGTPVIDPTLDIQVKLTNPGHIASSLAGMDLAGGGYLKGSLSQLDAGANLAVVRGELRLPGGHVTLEPGGTVRATYTTDSEQGTDAHVLVDLLGDSHVTTLRTSDVAQIYDIHLDVRGDLLLPDQVTFAASSSPPDLNQDQILALLGRTDLLAALGSNTYQQSGRTLTTAALGIAFPSLFDPVTAKLAADLRLDYLTVEYNALDQTSILAAKSLGHGFTLQGRRQISPPTPGLPLTYDFRLVYQPPFRSRLARRFTFFLGVDELTPWKFGVEYSQRF